MSDDHEKKEVDSHSGVETTGHEWDGIKELNNPAPRWWVWVFLLCCVWALGYWVLFPAWPTLSGVGVRGGTVGSKNWTSRSQLIASQAEITARRGVFAEQIKTHSLQEIKNDPALYEFAVAGGKTAFKENCAACHGTGAQGGNGYPNLNDDDWLWGGKLDDIYTTIKHGIRSTHEQTRISQMPAFGKDGVLNGDQIDDVADYVSKLHDGNKALMTPAYTRGKAVFATNCVACHGNDGEGNRTMGAPRLNDAIWLYGGDKASIKQQVINPRLGVMPTWEARLPDETIKQLTIYVHSLGGGE